MIGNIAETETILQNTAQLRFGTQCGPGDPPNNVYGWGIVDAFAALTGVVPAILTASPSSIAPGGTLTATWDRNASPTSTDWIGLYQPGAANTAYIEWMYVSCSKTPGSPQASGSCPFVVPASLAPGIYELRLLANDAFTLLATSNGVTIAPTTKTFLTASPSTIPPGETLTATWQGILFPTSTDWIGLYPQGSSDFNTYIDWIYVSCSKTPNSPLPSGSCPFVVPTSVVPATYELRLLTNDGFTSLATSNFVQVFSAQALGQVSGRR